MSRPNLLSPVARANVARAYHLGVSPSEIAADYGISSPQVIAYAKAADRRLMERKAASARRRAIAAPPPLVQALVRLETFETPSGYLAYRKFVPNRVALGVFHTERMTGDHISLPFVSILETRS